MPRVPAPARAFSRVLAVLCLSALVPCAIAQGVWRPEKPVEIIVPTGAGGTNDLNARLIQKTFQEQKIFPTPSLVMNKAGGNQSLAAVYTLGSAAVYSPTVENREAFAMEMSAKLGIPIKVEASAEAAARGHNVVVAASNSRSPDPIVRGAWLGRCRLLCAVGNTRSQYAEIDTQSLADAALVVGGTEHAFGEAGELRRAAEQQALPQSKRATLAQLVSATAKVPRTGMIVFKSVGSALQDLALAGYYYERYGKSAGVEAAPDLASVRERPAKKAGPRTRT